MRRILFGAVCILLGACSQSMVSPTRTVAEVEAQVVLQPPPDARVGYTGPLHHNIPFILPDGVTAGWLCETKPRRYVDQYGREEWTLDHYSLLGKGGCPDIPID